MWAARFEYTEIVELLLSLNADTTKIGNDGKTAAEFAKSDDIKQLLLNHERNR